MKHAYLIEVNSNFRILNLLIKMLDDEENDFFILIDAKVKTPISEIITFQPKRSKVIEVPRMKISWASYSGIQAVLTLLETAKMQGRYRYFTFMQGADFPIKKKSEISRFFKEHDGYEFIHFDPKWYEFGKYKINYHHFFVNNRYYRKSKFLKAISHGIALSEKKLGLIRNRNHIFSGSALFSITDNLCAYFLENKDRILKLSKYSLAADEVVFQTLIMETSFKDRLYAYERLGGNLYFIDWERRSGSSPHTFTEEDYDRLMTLPYFFLFARKFSESSSMSLVRMLYKALREEN